MLISILLHLCSVMCYPCPGGGRARVALYSEVPFWWGGGHVWDGGGQGQGGPGGGAVQ